MPRCGGQVFPRNIRSLNSRQPAGLSTIDIGELNALELRFWIAHALVEKNHGSVVRDMGECHIGVQRAGLLRWNVGVFPLRGQEHLPAFIY